MRDDILTIVTRWLAYRLPSRVIYWAVIRCLNWSTKDSPKGPCVQAPQHVSVYEVLNRWDEERCA